MIEPSSMVSTTARSGSVPAARRARASDSGSTTQPSRSSNSRSSLNAIRSLPAWVLSSTLIECQVRRMKPLVIADEILLKARLVGQLIINDTRSSIATGHEPLRPASMRRTAPTRWHIFLAWALALRAMIAPGYMPGGDGWPVRLCPDGLDSELVAVLFGGDHQHHGAGHARSSDVADDDDGGTQGPPPPHAGWNLERCALGQSLAQAALPGADVAPLQLLPHYIPEVLPARADPALRIERPRARAPPFRLVVQATSITQT